MHNAVGLVDWVTEVNERWMSITVAYQPCGINLFKVIMRLVKRESARRGIFALRFLMKRAADVINFFFILKINFLLKNNSAEIFIVLQIENF